MSINSLVNFGVPGPGGQRAPQLQPTFSNRFRIVFYNFGNTADTAPYELTRAVKSVGRPTLKFSEESIKSYLSTVYLASKAEWEGIDIKLYDDIDNEVMSRVQMQMSRQQNMFDQTAARAGQNYKFDFDIDVLAGGATASGSAVDSNVLQKWCIAGAWVTDANFSEMSYDETKFGEVTVKVRFDNAVCYDENGIRMGNYDHTSQIAGRVGDNSTGGALPQAPNELL